MTDKDDKNASIKCDANSTIGFLQSLKNGRTVVLLATELRKICLTLLT